MLGLLRYDVASEPLLDVVAHEAQRTCTAPCPTLWNHVLSTKAEGCISSQATLDRGPRRPLPCLLSMAARALDLAVFVLSLLPPVCTMAWTRHLP